MKLKNILVVAFLTLTLIPIIIVSLMLYKSGLDLSKRSYTRNLIESINVQADYISQTFENNMIYDSRFAKRSLQSAETAGPDKAALLSAFQSYLDSSEDKIAVCMLLDRDDTPIYTIGEKALLDVIQEQLPPAGDLTDQKIMEFELEQGGYSLGIVTPVRGNDGAYMGSLISIYDQNYIFKIISSYYKIADTFTYICRQGGEIIQFKGAEDDKQSAFAKQALENATLASQDVLNVRVEDVPVSGYYKNIHHSPWYLAGFIDQSLVYSFTNQFVWVYILIILGVLTADVILSLYFSQRVVEPINSLIKVMEGYSKSLNSNELNYTEESGYYETRFLWTQFLGMMKTILMVQHNFEGVYQLYQSSAMADTNIEIDVKSQTIHSNKSTFQKLMNELPVQEGSCIVERFIGCFCEKDQKPLMRMFENMRDEHLSVTQEMEVYTPHLDRKWFQSLVVPMYEGERLSRLFIQLRDISGFKKQEHDSFEQAHRDPLTGLYNRAGFACFVDKALQEGDESALHALLFIDMNYFKLVNDNFGHGAGDDLLRSVGQILLESIGPDDIVSRFGGDEFAVFLVGTTAECVDTTVRALTERLIYPYTAEKAAFTVSASIGVSLWRNTAPDTLEALLQKADAAMYQAKREYKKTLSGL